MALTSAIRRCKGCVFYQLYDGPTTNPVMKKLLGEEAPRTKRHACRCVLRESTTAEGEVIQTPVRFVQDVISSDKPGPRFGQRIGPNGICDYHTRKLPPYVRKKFVPIRHEAKPQVFLEPTDAENIDVMPAPSTS